MTFRELLEANFGNLPPTIRALAKGMDEQEEHLERVRVSLGFHEDWSPAYDRRQRSGTTAPVKWADKAAAMNGRGDMLALIGEMCAWMDQIVEKRAEVEARLDPEESETPNSCPKCGKTGRGLAMHMKHCVGKAAA